jgi:hypothetical protein
MARYGVDSNLEPQEVLDRATEFFGPDGLGLELGSRTDAAVSFVGGGGHVAITVCPTDSGTELDLETREWDYQVRQFMQKV